jgi:ferrochelatase
MNEPQGKAGVMLMAYGAPATLDDVAAFYTHIRGGRKPPQEKIDDLMQRYEEAGDCASLLRITEQTAVRLQETLDGDKGRPVQVFTGMRHSSPFIKDRMKAVASAGVTRLVGLPLAPYYSSLSTGAYHKALKEAAAGLDNPPELILVQDYHDHARFIAALAGNLKDSLEKIRSETGEPVRILFTAHSLPQRIEAAGEPYKRQLLETAKLVAGEAGETDWEFAFQSASPTGEPWMGPDFLHVVQKLAREGRRAILVAPIGFVSDHLEILYDIDILCRRVAAEAGARIWRTASLNDSPPFVAVLASIVRDRLEARVAGNVAR